MLHLIATALDSFFKILKAYKGPAVKGKYYPNAKQAIKQLRAKRIDIGVVSIDFYIKNKETDKAKAFIEVLKKLNKKKQELSQELDDKISGMYKNAEFKGPAPFKRR